MKFAPYLQSADPALSDRLGEVGDGSGPIWTVRDDHGEVHAIDAILLSEVAATLEAGRWMIAGPIPTYGVGDRLMLSLRQRNLGFPEPLRPNRLGEVVSEDASSVTVEDSHGESHRIDRINGHEYMADRGALRWVIIHSHSSPPWLRGGPPPSR